MSRMQLPVYFGWWWWAEWHVQHLVFMLEVSDQTHFSEFFNIQINKSELKRTAFGDWSSNSREATNFCRTSFLRFVCDWYNGNDTVWWFSEVASDLHCITWYKKRPGKWEKIKETYLIHSCWATPCSCLGCACNSQSEVFIIDQGLPVFQDVAQKKRKKWAERDRERKYDSITRLCKLNYLLISLHKGHQLSSCLPLYTFM